MRESLKALEGELVTVYGFNTEQRRHPDGRRFYMIKNPMIRRWDSSSAIKIHPTDPGLKLDHVWLEKSKDAATVERLQRTITVGRVGYYVRTDGSLDLGIRDIARIALMDPRMDRMVYNHNALMEADQHEQLVHTHKALEEIEFYVEGHGQRNKTGQIQYVLSQLYSYPEIKRWTREQRMRLDRVQASLLRAKVGHLPRKTTDTQSPSPGSAVFLNKQTQPHSGRLESELDRLLKGA